LSTGKPPLPADDPNAETVARLPPRRPGAADAPETLELWEQLGHSRALATLPAAAMRDLLAAATERRFEPGQVIVRQGDPAEGLWILIEGSAHVMLRDQDGAEHRIGNFRSGDVVGEMALVTRERRTATVIADSHVRAVLVPTAEFDRLATRHVELGIVLTDLIAERLGRGANDGFGGKLIDGFRILRWVGRGGMSVVYRAREEATEELVALKMMSYRLIYDPGALDRFKREAEILQGLDHPNIARLKRLFEAYNTYFLVMELCEGVDLARLVRRHGQLAEPQVRPILGQLATALEYVHQRGIVHRDLKPGNVMITRTGEVKLTDFGIAVPEVVVSERAAGRYAILGTPAFMAPEQLAGGPLDRRTDVYALGCLAYELLTGQHLFRSLGSDLMEEKLRLTLPPAAGIGGGISAELYEFLQRALSADPDDRPSSAAPLVEWAARCEPPPPDLSDGA
jgi:hypothetical protein